MNVRYDYDNNVFHLTYRDGSTKQVAGTSHTLQCSRGTIERIEEFMFYEFVA
jgi:hypothetical protein